MGVTRPAKTFRASEIGAGDAAAGVVGGIVMLPVEWEPMLPMVLLIIAPVNWKDPMGCGDAVELVTTAGAMEGRSSGDFHSPLFSSGGWEPSGGEGEGGERSGASVGEVREGPGSAGAETDGTAELGEGETKTDGTRDDDGEEEGEEFNGEDSEG